MKKLVSLLLCLVLTLCTIGGAVVYADDLNEGMYNFICVDGGRYLNVYAGQDFDGANVCVWDRDGSPEQNFKMVDRGGNRFVLYPSSSNGRVLDANRGNSYSNPLRAGNNIDIWQSNDAPAQEWYIDDRGNGKYTIELVNARGLVVTCDNPWSNNGNCSLQQYTGASNQLWYLQRADGGSVKKKTTSGSKNNSTSNSSTKKNVSTNSKCKHKYEVDTSSYRKSDDSKHYYTKKCVYCGLTTSEKTESHKYDKNNPIKVESISQNKHACTYLCTVCNSEIVKQENHKPQTFYVIIPENYTYHNCQKKCTICDFNGYPAKMEKHSISGGACKRCNWQNENGVGASKIGSCHMIGRDFNDLSIHENCPKCGSANAEFLKRKTIRKNYNSWVWGKISIYHQKVKCKDCNYKYWNRCYHEKNM